MRLPLLAAALLWPLCAHASQPLPTALEISTGFADARFKVNGTEYRGSGIFVWPEGSKHVVEFELRPDGFQYDEQGRTRWSFSGWRDSSANLLPATSSVLTITAHPSLTKLTAQLNPEHLVRLSFFDGAGAAIAGPAACGAPGAAPMDVIRPGVVYMGDSCYANSQLMWMSPGALTLNAFPYPGFVFLGWSIDGNTGDAALRSLEIRGPLSIVARFAPGKRVRFQTEPAGLSVLVDGVVVRTPDRWPCPVEHMLPVQAPYSVAGMCAGEFDWALGASHVLSAPSPQVDLKGNWWVFDGWAHGGAQSTVYTVASLLPREVFTARFVRGAQVSFLTEPHGLKLSVAGRENWASYNFVWGVGASVTVSAAPEQVDSAGRRYTFRGWSNGGEATQQVVVPASAVTEGLRLIARYELLPQLVVRSSPLPVEVEVDGELCSTPCVIDRPENSTVRLSLPATRQMTEAHRLDFSAWSDGASRVRTFSLQGREARQLTAHYRWSYRLVSDADPPGGAVVRLEPNSADSFYPEGTEVTATAQAQPGFRFRRWGGDVEGTYHAARVVMSEPKHIRALMERLQQIPPAVVRNAAGQTPDVEVAPGSVVSIFGEELAPRYEAGPPNLLAQVLAGVSVRLADRILPLFFVSPGQINAVLPSDLAEGRHELRIIRSGQPDVPGELHARRNAPGLYNRPFEGRVYAWAERSDGSTVEPGTAVRKGEVVSLYGTGWGPYDRPTMDGFPLPASPAYKLADEVELLHGDQVWPVLWAGGAPGQMGTQVLRIRVPVDVEMPALVELRIRVNGRFSNPVWLRVE